MPENDGTCEYVLDPNDPETWGREEGDKCYVGEVLLNSDGVWTCPHNAEGENDLCIFHRPISEKNDKDVVKAFLNAINKSSTSIENKIRWSQFIGAKFGDFRLSEVVSNNTVEAGELVMDYAEFAGELSWSGLVIDISAVRMNGIQCVEDADFSDTIFHGDTNFYKAKFDEASDFTNTSFDGQTTFSAAIFGGATTFVDAEFKRDTGFTETEFKSDTNFKSAKFEQDNNFKRSVFEKRADFRYTDFEGFTLFSDANFWADTDFTDAEFSADTGFSNAEFRANADFGWVEFGATTNFKRTTFEEDAGFRRAKFEEDADFRRAEFREVADFKNADLTDATFIKTNICDADFESTLLSRATLFGADLRGAKLSGAILGDAHIDEDTKFLGHSSDDTDISPHTISAIRSRPTCVYDPDYEEKNEHEDVDKAKSVYRALEELGSKHARPQLQARSFVRRQDLQKKDYWNDATADNSGLEERLIAGARWSRAKVARATLLYGESPWRVIAWSLGIIFSFALLYPIGGWMKPTDSDPITYAQIASNPVDILDSVYYSTLTYTALGFGDFQPVGFGRALTTIETGIGAILLALLVFVLGRRAAR